jgi:O-antigen/teichoic acid export membrane protein
MSHATELAKNTLILAFGRIFSQFVSFLLLPLYTFVLTPKQYGIIDLIITYVTLLAPLFMLQLDRAAFRYLIDARGDDAQITRVVSSTLAIVVPILAVASAVFLVLNSWLRVPYAELIVTAIVATIFSTIFLQLARGLGRNLIFSIASVLSAFTLLAFTIALVAVWRWGVEGVLWSTIAANLATVVFLFLGLRLDHYLSYSAFRRDMQRRLLAFSWPLVPSAISWWFIRTSDRTIIAIFLGVAANGLYAAASKYTVMFLALYSIFDLSWTESASTHIDSQNRDAFFSSVYDASFRFFGAVGLGLLAITPFLFRFIIGAKFAEAYVYIPVLVVGVLLQIIVSLYSVIYIAKKATQQVLITSVVTAAVSLTLNLSLIHVLNIWAAALSSAVAFLIMAVWRHHDIKKYVNVQLPTSLFATLIGLYLLAGSLYYINNAYLNWLNLIMVSVMSIALTRAIWLPLLSSLRTKGLGMTLKQFRGRPA